MPIPRSARPGPGHGAAAAARPGIVALPAGAPIRDARGRCIPSLYAASTVEAAIHETIFHDIPAGAGRATVPETLIRGRAHGRLEILRDLRLAALRAPDLRRWRIRRDEPIGAPPGLYPETARRAAAIHRLCPDVEGLVWTANRCDPESAWLFFGDRVAPVDFRVVAVRDGRTDASLLADARAAGRRCGIAIVV